MWTVIASIALRLIEMALDHGAKLSEQRLDRLERVAAARRRANAEADRIREEIERRRKSGDLGDKK